MATVMERESKYGTTYRVIFKRKGKRKFYITFDDWEFACDWAKEHEEKYYEDPQPYHDWKESIFLIMRKKKVHIYKHICRPVIK